MLFFFHIIENYYYFFPCFCFNLTSLYFIKIINIQYFFFLAKGFLINLSNTHINMKLRPKQQMIEWINRQRDLAIFFGTSLFLLGMREGRKNEILQFHISNWFFFNLKIWKSIFLIVVVVVVIDQLSRLIHSFTIEIWDFLSHSF